MLPQDGVGGLTERPRKASAPSRVTTVAMPMRRNETPIGRDVGQQLLHQDAPVGGALDLGGDARSPWSATLRVALRITR